MSYALPNESKYKIYISALTSLNVDEHNRISTADGRLLRRLVRDARTRGTSAGQTIAQWPSVRRGEEENIFPFQESADATFNSALIYELCVLKPMRNRCFTVFRRAIRNILRQSGCSSSWTISWASAARICRKIRLCGSLSEAAASASENGTSVRKRMKLWLTLKLQTEFLLAKQGKCC